MKDKKRIIITLSDEIQKELIENDIDLPNEIKKKGMDFDITLAKHPNSPEGTRDVIQTIEIISAAVPLIVTIAIEIIKSLKPTKTTVVTEKRYPDGTIETIINLKN